MAAAGAVKLAAGAVDEVSALREGIKVKIPEFIRVEIDTVKGSGVLGHGIKMTHEFVMERMEWHDSHKRSPLKNNIV